MQPKMMGRRGATGVLAVLCLWVVLCLPSGAPTRGIVSSPPSFGEIHWYAETVSA